jgi:hypothetical protein
MPESHVLHASSNVHFDGIVKPYFILGVETSDGDRQFGNGFILAEWPDTIITAAHVVSDARKVRAKAWTGDGGVRGFDCRAVAYDSATDLAVLRLPQSVQLTRSLAIGTLDAGSVALRAYLDHDAWKHKRLRWPTVGATRSSDWLVYETRYGEQGASGAALADATSDGFIVGVHHGRVRVDARIVRAAAVCDRAILDSCRSLVG